MFTLQLLVDAGNNEKLTLYVLNKAETSIVSTEHIYGWTHFRRDCKNCPTKKMTRINSVN